MWFLGTCWFVTFVSAVFAGLQLIFGLNAATSAPQQASVAAIAAASVVIPYVFTRAVEGMVMLESLKRQRQGDRGDAAPAARERTEPAPKRGIDRMREATPIFREGQHDRPSDPGNNPRW